MNILITGCKGQLGREMQLLSQEHAAHCYFFTDVQELDITDPAAIEACVADNRINLIVNCAAYTAVDKAESDQALCALLNATAPRHLAEAAQHHGAGLIHISTDYVFDGTAHVPYQEDHLVNPQTIYGHTKAEGEEAVRQACEQYAIVRTGWLYSPWGNNFVKTMLRLGHEREELGVIFDQIGTPTSARSLARALYAIIGQGIQTGTYHFAGEGVASWYDFTLAIHRLAGITTCRVRPLHTEEYPTPAHRPHYSVLDKTKFKQTYGLTIPHWMESLRECIQELENK